MFNISLVRPLRVSIAVIGSLFASFLIATLMVSVYVINLGFQLRGAPDPNGISQFANSTIPAFAPLIAAFSTFIVTWFAVRRLGAAALTNALAVGALVAIIQIVLSFVMQAGAVSVLEPAATLVSSMAAGWLVMRGMAKQQTL